MTESNKNTQEQTPEQKKADLLNQRNNPAPQQTTLIQSEPVKQESSADKEILLFIKKQTKVIDEQKTILEKQKETIDSLKEEIRGIKENQAIQFKTYADLEKNIETNENLSVGKLSESYYKNKIEKDDILKEEVVFSAYGIGIGFGSYMKNGFEVLSPYGMIMFKYQGTDVNNNGDSKHFSIYKTRSKKELEFIRNHPGYGRLFSENLNYTLSTDHQKHIQMAQIYSQVLNMSSDQVFAACNYYGIENDGQVSKLREKITAIKMKELEEQMTSKELNYKKEQERVALLRKSVDNE